MGVGCGGGRGVLYAEIGSGVRERERELGKAIEKGSCYFKVTITKDNPYIL